MKYIVSVMFLLLPLAARAQSAAEIIRKSEDAIKGSSCRGTFSMTVVTPDYTRRMEMESWWVGNDKALIVIRAPKKEAGNKTLKIGNEMWSYLRNTEMTIKIPPSMMLQSWNGSDFTNDDLVRESNLEKDYSQSLTGNVTRDGEECWSVLLLPRPNAPVVWGRIIYIVRKSDYLPSRIEYFDEKKRLMRVMEFADIRPVGKRTIPTKWIMINSAKPGHRTEFEIVKADFDIGIPDRIFSLRELERGN
ncbi:MAG: outer membrane lipoprotein-sorting protein [Ignavibacteriae bacterium]|nr:outer membrane lipoprotein-sorting protein [Ignavibacteriota bacterium]